MAKDRSQTVRDLGGDNRRKDPFDSLERQIQAEYNLSWKHQKAKKDESEIRLKLLNNQKRDKKAVGDTTMFSIFQTVLASLYDDRLTSVFEGKEEGDEDVAENLNALAESDYAEMEKDVSDFFLDWDTCFFGRGLLGLEEYIRDPEKNIFLPVPQVLDPITFLRDPYANSINGDKFHRGSCRFFGYEVKMTKAEMLDNASIFDGIDYNELNYGGGALSLLTDAIQARNEAQNNQTQLENEKEKTLGANAQFTVTLWYTYYENPKTGTVERVKVWLGNNREKVIGFKYIKTDYWPVIDRPLYPHSHDWDGTSIPDLTEDKQRARAMTQNLGLRAVESDIYPRYIYDSNKITNRNDLNIKFNKHIPVDAKDASVGNALQPVITPRPNLQLLDFIYTSLDLSAQKATATPDIQQGIQSAKDRPLGETNLLAQRADTRYSLGAKVFGWSEKRFWQYWYNLYKDNFGDKIDEKVVRLEGAFGPKWRPLRKDDIIPQRFDPDVKIESQTVNRTKQLEERTMLTGYFSLALQDPTANRRYALKKLGRLNGLKKDEMDRLFPPTIDERIAEQENERLNDDKLTPVKVEDDHEQHLEIHSKANDTRAAKIHIKAHELALMIRKVRPELFPQQQDAGNVLADLGKPVNGNPPAPTPGVPALSGNSQALPIVGRGTFQPPQGGK